ncbi:putative dienelactone hydrolase [Burkholderia sp. THE68]|uniref:dienelactone hydrolase family protein n=1 Tax=Burkholderia sp. THE68 TaxID=758782 RepID=UPI00131920D2|nr:dienelactone hydrolase family protein [Burkholderia sp. THE68]BBU30269.1 putative dienelactone hydrolase [Burkholderia sp. THE68]
MPRKGRRAFMKIAVGTPFLASGGTRAATPAMAYPDQRMQNLGFSSYRFSDGAYEHLVYVKGAGPDVVVLHELPGFDDHTVNFIDRLSKEGFRIHAPHLYGTMLWTDTFVNFGQLCISREFGYLKANQSAPVCDWLRGLARSISEESANARIGVIGMCLTGAFVIPMIIEPGVRAGVISQPAIPLPLKYAAFRRGAGEWMQQVNVSDADFSAATKRCARDKVPILVQRFKNDQISFPDRNWRIKQAFGDNAELYEYENPRLMESPRDFPHALLTKEYDTATFEGGKESENSTRVALARVVRFLKQNLFVPST